MLKILLIQNSINIENDNTSEGVQSIIHVKDLTD